MELPSVHLPQSSLGWSELYSRSACSGGKHMGVWEHVMPQFTHTRTPSFGSGDFGSRKAIRSYGRRVLMYSYSAMRLQWTFLNQSPGNVHGPSVTRLTAETLPTRILAQSTHFASVVVSPLFRAGD